MTEEVHVTHSVIRYMGDPRLCVSGSVHPTTDRPRKGKKFRNCQGVKNFSTHSLLLLLRCLRFTYLFNPRIRVARIVLLYNRMWSLVCTHSLDGTVPRSVIHLIRINWIAFNDVRSRLRWLRWLVGLRCSALCLSGLCPRWMMVVVSIGWLCW